MNARRAALWLDHRSTRVLPLDDDTAPVATIRAHSHPTAQHGSGVRALHEYFGHVCDAIDSMSQVLLTGAHMSLADFRRYVDERRPGTAERIIAYTVLDHASDRQLLAGAREHFAQFDRLASARDRPT
jgi:stalled ribosome rescue protein Dom34